MRPEGPGGPQRPLVTAPMPIRGSLFKQGATAAAAPAAIVAGDAQIMPPSPPVSFIAVQPAQPRKYRKNDLLTVIVREDSDASSTGQADAKKTQAFDLAIQQMAQLALSQSGVPTVTSVGAPSKLPEIKFNYTNNRQSDSSQDRTDSFSARISATIVDVKPNGTLVIEAVKQIVVDKEEQTFKLTGVCRAEDVAVDNTILSTQLANLSLSKQTKGEVRDGIKRGWLNSFIDHFSPF